MEAAVDMSRVTPRDEYRGEDVAETEAAHELIARAEAFLSSFQWVAAVRVVYVGLVVPEVVGVFLIQIQPSTDGVDECLWVVVGDLPPAYLVTDDAATPEAALRSYIDEMRRWAAAAAAGDPLDEIIPVNAVPSRSNAADLEKRLRLLQRFIDG